MAPAANPSILRHLPNALTGLRMLLVAPLAWLILAGRYDIALVVAAVAGLTDAFDGFLAKRCGWQSWLGGILDPIADKLMLVGCFVSLGLVGAHPEWLTWLVVGRDVVIVVGAVVYHNLIGRISAQPTLFSKFTTCIQITYVLGQLVNLSTWFSLPRGVMVYLVWLTAVCTVASGAQYVVVWSARAMRARTRETMQ
jgi:cardiolipin synthase (CMP-forming)